MVNHKLKKFCTFRGLLKSLSLRKLASGLNNLGQDNKEAAAWTIAARPTHESIQDGRPIEPITPCKTDSERPLSRTIYGKALPTQPLLAGTQARST